jgi:hypothetical protein
VTLLRPLIVETAGDLTGRLDAFYSGAGGGSWTLWSAWPTPDLSPLGYSLIGQPPLMVRPPGGEPYPIPPGLRIVEVEDEETLAKLERTFIEGYGLATMATARPGQLFRAGALGGPTHFWIGYEGDHPVTTAVSTVGEGVVGIYFVATLSEARGRGYGAAITDAAARVDPSLPALLQSSDLGRPVYERLGFETVSRYGLWLRPRGQVIGDG